MVQHKPGFKTYQPEFLNLHDGLERNILERAGHTGSATQHIPRHSVHFCTEFNQNTTIFLQHRNSSGGLCICDRWPQRVRLSFRQQSKQEFVNM